MRLYYFEEEFSEVQTAVASVVISYRNKLRSTAAPKQMIPPVKKVRGKINPGSALEPNRYSIMARTESISEAPNPTKAAPIKTLMYKGTVRAPCLSVGKILLKNVPMTTMDPAFSVVSCFVPSKPNLIFSVTSGPVCCSDIYAISPTFH